MNYKYALSLICLVIAVVFVGTSTKAANKSPFDAIWIAIDSLQEQIASIPAGPQGPVGPQGPQGHVQEIKDTEVYFNDVSSSEGISLGDTITAEVSCPGYLLSGGARAIYSGDSPDVQVALTESYPHGTSTWIGVGRVVGGPATSTGNLLVTVHAICASTQI